MNKKITIEQCIKEIPLIMEEMHYSKQTIDTYKHRFNTIKKYCDERGIIYFDDVVGLEFLKDCYGINLTDLVSSDKNTNQYKWGLRIQNVLSEYSISQTFNPRICKHHPLVDEDAYWRNIYECYLNYLEKQDYKKSTIAHKEVSIRKCLNIFVQNNITTLDEIDKAHINTVVSSFIHEAPKSVTHRIGELKQFFTYCFNFNLTKENKALLIPNVTTAHESHLPISWDENTVTKLLKSIDRDNPVGKRNYAIILLSCRLGIRGIDIISLNLSDLNWETREITIKQEKTNNTITLPILNDVGWALIDYIRNARPISKDNHVFLTSHPPYKALERTGSLNSIFRKQMSIAKIPIPREARCGIHSLRHTLGRILLEKETPLPVISQILGHQSIQSTDVYLHIDMKGLASCPIDPDKVFTV